MKQNRKEGKMERRHGSRKKYERRSSGIKEERIANDRKRTGQEKKEKKRKE